MAEVWINYVPWIYAVIQAIITLIVSIIGVKYVMNQFKLQKGTAYSPLRTPVNIIRTVNDIHSTTSEVNIQIHDDKDSDDPDDATNGQQYEVCEVNSRICLFSKTLNITQKLSKIPFYKLWFIVVWKLRNVYGPLAVHLFDILTDILVIISWYKFPDIQGDGIDPIVMANCAIIVLLFHKFISIVAFWAKEKSIKRCLLQLFDLLIFQEIYLSHQRVTTHFKHQSKALDSNKITDKTKEDTIETTSSFKYVRNLEAVFESIPQSILQLVFIIRIGWQSDKNDVLLAIFIASMVQSIISMTNSILKNDNQYMTLPKWHKHRQRWLPTIPFVKHAICRLAEVLYRIGLCALFWAVCGGVPFAIFISVEIILLLGIVVGWDDTANRLNAEDWCLRIQELVIMPSELVYAQPFEDLLYGVKLITLCGGSICFCSIPAILISTLCCHRDNCYMHMTIKIGLSMLEWSVLIVWSFMDEDKFNLLFNDNHGLYVFIISIICYLVYTQYLALFPNFSLPHNIPIRSNYGYAFNGELEELKRIKDTIRVEAPIAFDWNDEDPSKSMLYCRVGSDVDRRIFEMAFFGELTQLMSYHQEMTVKRYHTNWNYRKGCYDYMRQTKLFICPALLALSNKQYEVVKWLEDEQGANYHQKLFRNQSVYDNMDYLFAREYLPGIWDKPYKGTMGTCILLALSNKQYHVVEWLMTEEDVKLPYNFDGMEYRLARKCIGDHYFV